jgi:adenylosuccinate lyase
MIPRYTRPEMGAVWSDQRKYETWLDVELAATDALSAQGVVPAEDAKSLRAKAAFDVARIDEIEQTTQHDVIAFTTAVAEHAGPSARWLHFGMTSSDVLDTALALQMRQACDLILEDVDALLAAIRRRADEHRRTPMIGRTHGVHAEPMTFGVKLALWFAEVTRGRERLVRAREAVAVGKVSGAVGMFAHLDPSIEAAVCERLGLTPAPVSSQVIQRDRHADGGPDSRRARRAHDDWRQSRALVRRSRARPRAHRASARHHLGRQDLGRRRHVRPSRSVD